ncbi:MAG: helix-turn-helix domain-containing protein [Nitrososphaerales archaeon]
MTTNSPEQLRFITLVEAARILQVSKRTLLRMIQKKKMMAFKVGDQRSIPESRFREWLKLQCNLDYE